MNKIRVLVVILLLASAAFTNLFADAYYVSPKGSDTNPGTEEKPFRTIQVGVNALTPGSTLYIKAGTYREKITIKTGGAPGKFVTIRPYKGAQPVLDGKNVPGEASIYMHDKSYVKIIGLKIMNNSAASPLMIPKGIFIDGCGTSIYLVGNAITKINSAKADESNAFGIAVFGTEPDEPISDFVIDSNYISNCTLGRGGAIVLNGNVENFRITDNTVKGHDNTGISFRGFRGTCPEPDFDQARAGPCRSNSVSNIDSFPNPVFKGKRVAAGIHVDGARDINIEKNRVFNCNYGIAAGCWAPDKTATGVKVKNNFIFYCHVSGISLGGPSRDPVNAKGAKSAAGCAFLNNTLFNNGVLNTAEDQYGTVSLQWASSCTFRNNIFYVCDSIRKSKNPGVSNDENNSFKDIDFDENVWYYKGGQKFLYFTVNGSDITGFSKWQSLGFDTNSSFINPEFKDSVNFPPTLRLRKTSKVKNAGVE